MKKGLQCNLQSVSSRCATRNLSISTGLGGGKACFFMGWGGVTIPNLCVSSMTEVYTILIVICLIIARIWFGVNVNDLDLLIPTLTGDIFYKSMEGRAESEMDRTYGEKSLGNQKSYKPEAMMAEILKGGGEANLAKVTLF